MSEDNKNSKSFIYLISNILEKIFSLNQTDYVNENNNEEINQCFKVLILDQLSCKFLSPIIKQNSLTKHKICLTVNLSDQKQKIKNVMGLYIIYPSKDNLNIISNDIKNQIYQNYSINFIEKPNENLFQDFLTNIIQSDSINKIYNIGIFPISIYIYHSHIFDSYFNKSYFFLNKPNLNEEDSNEYYNKISNSLFSCIFSFKESPKIYYRKDSISETIINKIQNRFNSSFNTFPELKRQFIKNETILIILDRDIDLPIMFHHSASFGSMINDICGFNNNNLNNNKNTFIVDPINDFIWEKNIKEPFYEVGEKTYIQYQQYFEEIKLLNLNNKINENNINELNKETEKLFQSINSIDTKKIEGDILSKHANTYNIIKENTNKREIAEIFSIEDLLLKKREENSEINNKINEIKEKIKKENAEDILRMCIILYLIYGDKKKDEINNLLKGNYSTDFINKIFNFLELKKLDKNSSNPYEKKEIENNLTKKYLKKGFNFIKTTITKMIKSDEPSIIANIINSIYSNKNLENFSSMQLNNTIIKENDNIKNIIVYILGGGCLAEYEYICDKIGNNVNIYYGCDKLYSPKEFLNEIIELSNNIKNNL